MGKETIDRILGRRERKKQETCDALEFTALRLFQRKGYDETTIEHITDAVDVSTRTFFRYFDSKEAVLFSGWRSSVDRLSELIASRPPEEAPLVAMYEAAKQFVELGRPDESNLRLRRKLSERSRKIGDYERNVINPAFERAVTEALAQRLGVDPDTDPRPSLYAAVAVATWHAARNIWIASDGEQSMVDLLRQAFEFVTSQNG